MTEAASPFHLERFPLVFRTVRVRRVEQLAPRYRRITFGSDELAGFRTLAAADHVKIFFPAPGDD
jgi:NADPH-dependent ferric siderophore reductase